MGARKTSTKPTRTWKFSARVEDPEAVREMLFVANRYYNALVAIERARHGRFVAIRRCHAPELAALEDEWERLDEQIEEVYRAVKRERQTHWRETDGEKRRLMPPAAEAQIATLKAEQKRVSEAAKTHRAAFKTLLEPGREAAKRRSTERAAGGGPRTKSAANAAVLAEMVVEPQWGAAWTELARSDDQAHRATLAARESCGLATGTYLQIEEAVQRAKKDSAPHPPRFHRFDGSGRLAVQVRDSTYADALAGLTRIAISPAPRLEGKRGDQSRIVCVLLDQSVPRGERRKIAMTAKLHRVPPSDADIKWAALMVRRIGARTVYELQLTLEHKSFAESKRPAGQRASEHIAIGWARVDGGVRVAHWSSGDVVVPDTVLAQHEHAAAITSAADRHFERAKRMLHAWMRGGPHRITTWHRMLSDRDRAMLRRICVEYARHVLGDVSALWSAWKAERLPRGEDLFASACVARRWLAARGIVEQSARAAWWLYTWARKDEHLCQYAVDSARRFQARRDAFFRREAIRVATEYETVTVDSYKIAGLRELPSLTMPGDMPRDQAQHNATAAAPGRFRELLVEVMGPRCTPCERSGGEQKAEGARKRKAPRTREVAGVNRAMEQEAASE